MGKGFFQVRAGGGRRIFEAGNCMSGPIVSDFNCVAPNFLLVPTSWQIIRHRYCRRKHPRILCISIWVALAQTAPALPIVSDFNCLAPNNLRYRVAIAAKNWVQWSPGSLHCNPYGSMRFPWGLPCPALLCPNVAPWVSPWVSLSVTNLGIELLSQLKICNFWTNSPIFKCLFGILRMSVPT